MNTLERSAVQNVLEKEIIRNKAFARDER